ncbi:MAG: fluoride efflux transporter CrcB [Campylobacterales bacterium]|nr:fluoride efflux transporter CrcB [Campylobacterales bacterium]
MSWQTLIAIGSGGFLGAISRAYINALFAKEFGTAFPYSTLFVNVVGSFFIGFLLSLFNNIQIDTHVKSFLTTGFLGALTTFSTFSIETYFLLEINILNGILNIVLNLIGSIVAAIIGLKVVNLIF